MELKTKKIIAREFLLFAGILLFTLSIYGSFFLYNGYLRWRVSNLKEQKDAKEQTIDSLVNTAYNKKKSEQKSFYGDVKEMLETINIPKWKKVNLIYNFMEEQGVNLPVKRTFIRQLRQDSAVRAKVYSLLKDKGVKNLPSREGFEAIFAINNKSKKTPPPSPEKELGKKKNPFLKPFGKQPESLEKLLFKDSLNPQKFWQHLSKIQKQDSLSYKWNNQWSKAFKAVLKENGITSATELRKFIKSNTITEQDKKNKELAGNLKKERWDLRTQIHDYEINQLGTKEKWNVAFYSLIGLLGLAYPVRLFVLAVKWSVLTLKKDKE